MARSTRAPAARFLPDLLAFGIGLGLAYHLEWETKDLVWSLWLCSLVLGYLTLLSAMVGAASAGRLAMRRKGLDARQRRRAAIAGIIGGLFLLAFFSLHFGGFHAAHSVFLQHFFPLAGMPDDGFGAAFINPPLLWTLALLHLAKPYGLFLVPAIIAERRQLLLPLKRAAESARADLLVADGAAEKRGRRGHPLADAMARPYVNVVRMHLLIFAFALFHLLNVESFLVYAIVYSVYFFPWSEVRGVRARRAGGSEG